MFILFLTISISISDQCMAPVTSNDIMCLKSKEIIKTLDKPHIALLCCFALVFWCQRTQWTPKHLFLNHFWTETLLNSLIKLKHLLLSRIFTKKYKFNCYIFEHTPRPTFACENLTICVIIYYRICYRI